MANNPTIVAASLSDQDLKNSIDKLLKHVDDATKSMAKSMDSAVEQMKRKLGELGNVKIEIGGTSSSGNTKKAVDDQKSLEEQTKKTTQAAKEQNMTFDEVAQGLKQAMGVISNFNTLRQHIDPSRQDYAEYERALARIVEYNEKLKVSALGLATANEKAYSYNAKADVKNLFSVDERLKQLNQYYAEEEKLSKRASERRIAAQEKETAAQKKMIDEQYKLAYSRTNKIPTDQYDLVQAKLERLQALLRDMRERGLLNPSQIASTEAEIRRLQQILSSSVHEQQQLTQSSQKYTEEIRKQAKAIRESAEWKEKGYTMVGERVYYDPERSSLSAKQRLSLEEQILNTQKEQEVEAIRRASAERQEAAEKAAAEQAAQRQLAAETQITNEQAKRSQPKTFASYDDLRQSIAHVLGLQKEQVKVVDEEYASYNRLSSALKQYRQAYYSLTESERSSDNGKNLLRRIQEIDRAIQKIQSQASRPISLSSILGINGRGGLSEKTLDDIAYKMQRLASYRSGLDVDTQKKEINQVNSEYDRLKKKMDEVMQKNQQMVGSNNALGRSWNYMKNRLAFYFTVGASTQFVKNLIEIRSQYEMNERALGILINSAERGTQIFQELSQMALVSPYTLIELSAAAKQLTAYDIAAKDVVDTTRRLADMASAVGVPMERLTYALGQIKAYGYLNSRDARMFANAGIPLVRELSKYYTELEGKMVSVGDVYDRMKKKAIDYNEVMAVVTKMTDEGGKFFDFQAKMADTLKVRLANLTLAWNNMLNDIGKSEQGVLTSGINLLKEFFLRWKDINRAIEDLVIVFGVLKAAQLAYYGMVLGTNKAIAIETVLGTKLSNVLRNLGTTMNTVLTSATTWWSLLAVAIGAAIVEVVRGNEAMKEFNKTLRENAKNTYNDLEKFKEQYKELRESLYQTITDKNGKTIVTPQDINVDDAKKAWESVKEQIELSSRASDKYIGSLLQIKNLSERLRQGFAVIDDIQSVSAAIKEIGDGTIKLERDWSAWWNLWTFPDGTIGNLKDTHMWLGKIEEKYGSIEKARKAASGEEKALFGIDKNYQDDAERWLENYENELKKFREDLESTKESVLNFINAQGWSGNVNKVNETFKQITDNLIQQNQLDPEKAYTLQIEMEEARSKAAKEAQYIRLQDLRNAYMAEKDSLHKEEIAKEYEKEAEIYNNWNLYNGRQKVEWERFTKYLKEQHLSEMTAMFRGMNDEQIKSLNFQEGKYADWVKRMVTNYAKSHKMSYDEAFSYLRNWVTSANRWSIYIPLTISTEGQKTVIKSLEEADAAADKAWKDMQRLDKEIARLQKKGAKKVDENNITASENDQRLTEALKERAAAQKDYDKAIEEGGHSKKEDAAATKAQKAAESELQKALKEELKIIDEVSSMYKKMTDSGISRTTALTYITNKFVDSVEHINAVLGKNNIPKFDIRKFAGTDDPHRLLQMLEEQRMAAKLSKNVKPEEVGELEIKYEKIDVDAKAYDATKIKKGLDNELGRLKDEYELAVELDANPELGSMFADMFNIDLDTLPRTAREYAEMYTKSLNKYFKEMKTDIELPNMLNLTRDDMAEFERQLENNEISQVYFDKIQKGYESTHEALKKEVSDSIKEYDKLIQKYAEYQYKLTQIAKEANNERKALVVKFGTNEQKEQARKIYAKLEVEDDSQKAEELKEQLKALVDQVVGDDQVRIQLKVAIDNKEAQESAKASFEEFQKSPEWILATGDLVGMTDKALGGLIDKLEEYKKSAKDLDPKQIKNLNNALKNLYKQRRQGNPFSALINAMSEAKNRASDLQPEIDKVSAEIERLESIENKGNIAETADELEKLKNRLNELKKVQQDVSELSTTEWVDSLKSSFDSIKTAIGLFDDLAKAISGAEESDLDKVFKVIDKAVSGAQAGSSFGTYGAIIGAVVGAASGIITEYKDVWNGQKRINDLIKVSTDRVSTLTTAYNKLQRAIEDAYGMEAIGQQKLALLNKQAQLAELERQLELEKSRSAKNRDLEKISELEDKVEEARYELGNATREMVQDLIGIGDAQDWADNFVTSMIQAFRKGEDYMQQYDEAFQNMVDSLISKAIAGKLIGEKMEEWLTELEYRTYGNAESNPDVIAAQEEVNKWQDYLNTLIGLSNDNVDVPTEELDRVKKELWDAQQKYAELFQKASELSGEDVQEFRDNVSNWRDDLKNKFTEYMEMFGVEFGSDKEGTGLSALQQGIQGITETTADAIEAYMNGVSQQSYLQSDLLTQIRDIVNGYDLELQSATMAQMLLQLQQSYQIQQNIHSLLQGVLSANGMSFKVEMV